MVKVLIKKMGKSNNEYVLLLCFCVFLSFCQHSVTATVFFINLMNIHFPNWLRQFPLPIRHTLWRGFKTSPFSSRRGDGVQKTHIRIIPGERWGVTGVSGWKSCGKWDGDQFFGFLENLGWFLRHFPDFGRKGSKLLDFTYLTYVFQPTVYRGETIHLLSAGRTSQDTINYMGIIFQPF